MLSIASQKEELLKIVSEQGYELADSLEESYSAKRPGRKVFNAMISRIEKGEAQGLIVWHANRVSRNSVDTGRVIYLMDQGKLLEVVTPGQIYRNTPQDKFLLNLPSVHS